MSIKQPDNETVSLQQLLVELQDVVQLALDAEKKELRPDIDFSVVMKQLLQVRNAVQAIHDAYRKTLSEVGFTEEQINQLKEDESKWKPDQRRLLQSLQKLQQQCVQARDRIYKSLQENRTSLRQLEKDLKSKDNKMAAEKPVKATKPKKARRSSGWMKT